MIIRRKQPMSMRLLCCMISLLFIQLLPQNLSGQNKMLRKEAFRLYDLNRMYEAELKLAEYCRDHAKDGEAHYLWIRSLYATNKLDKVITQCRLLRTTSKRFASEATFMLARAHHQKHMFSAAIKFYKEFLKFGDSKIVESNAVINDIKRCAEGLRHSLPLDDVFLENMGGNVNSQFDDFAPIASPNVETRIYFTSNRSARVNDQFSDDGTLITSVQKYDCDMYATEIDNGAWSAAFPLNDDLNSDKQEILQDFSGDGMVAYFTKGPSYDQNVFYVDSFASETQDPKGVPWQEYIFEENALIRGIHFFSDSTLFFSSNQSGGFGGYDLYMSVLSSDGWTSGINLGSRINSSFDEITPFLAFDGRTLYFSSNRLSSMGGHDIFTSRFNERELKWNVPENLALPINSAGDDVHYRISPNGQSAHFNSDRKTGKGGQDIYAAYFKQPMQSQLVRSVPPIFYMVKDFQLFSESLAATGNESNNHQNTLLESEWNLQSLLYREDDQMMTNQNQVRLDNLIGFMKTYPHLQLEILGHSDQSSISNFDLFFSIKRTERIAEYLQANGIDLQRVSLKGFGGSYPYAVNTIAGQDNKAGRFFNRRIDFKLFNTDKLPLTIRQQLPSITNAQTDGRLDSFYQRRQSLYYRVEFAVLDQLFKGDLIGKYPDPSIEKSASELNYHYTSGIFSSFALALQHLAEIKDEGFEGALIIPYNRGQRLAAEDITESMMDQYPDLKEFMLYLK